VCLRVLGCVLCALLYGRLERGTSYRGKTEREKHERQSRGGGGCAAAPQVRPREPVRLLNPGPEPWRHKYGERKGGGGGRERETEREMRLGAQQTCMHTRTYQHTHTHACIHTFKHTTHSLIPCVLSGSCWAGAHRFFCLPKP
jgi:hypothetical protein